MPTQTLEDILETVANDIRDDFFSRLDELGLESPIELALAAGFYYQFLTDDGCWPGVVNSLKYRKGEACTLEFCRTPIPVDHKLVLIYPQVSAGPYLIDFLVRYQFSDKVFTIAVECDGHDFHERTKQQAEHDKRRDRYLQSLDLTVLHFTGSEIWRDPTGCAGSVLDLLQDRVGEFAEREWREVVG